jgi:predicted CXXCH cytochrome family protein
VKLKLTLACVLGCWLTITAFGQTQTRTTQITGDVIGMHDLSPGGKSPIQGTRSGSCTYCHVPHSGNGEMAPLWNQKLSKATYQTYASSTDNNKANQQMPLGSASGLCLSCHDGTVAVGDTVLFGQVPIRGSWLQGDQFGTNLQSSHPFSLIKPLQDNIHLTSTLATAGKTGDKTGAVHLENDNVECTSCHNPHVQSIDKMSANFLVRDSSDGQMCLACHDPMRTTMGGKNQMNPLAGWSVSVHALAQNKVSLDAKMGNYGTLAANACLSCHAPHNAAGAQQLTRGTNEAACISCHSGGSNISPAASNVFAEYRKISHPLPNGSNQHDNAEKTVLNNNRHATCADCHNAHASRQVTSFNVPPLIRVSQSGTMGVAADGMTTMSPAVNQYENCLRCHGFSAGKATNQVFGYTPSRAASDPLNIILQMNTSAKSSHPVMHVRSSSRPQPSLLTTMLDVNGGTTHGRSMGSQIFCTDCHNSDDNREFGGSGPSGSHGSRYGHILEHDYEYSEAPAGPGTLITVNLHPRTDLSVNGPYGMCAKCHNLSIVMQSTSWKYHKDHVAGDGFSCSTCHNPHGMNATSANLTGASMVDFDMNVVGRNGSFPISYDPGSNTCTLQCHNTAHDPGGSIRKLSGAQPNSGAIGAPVKK